MKLNTLWFVRLESRIHTQIVFCLTAPDADKAQAMAMDGVADLYRADFYVGACEALCKTRDTVVLFEPV